MGTLGERDEVPLIVQPIIYKLSVSTKITKMKKANVHTSHYCVVKKKIREVKQ